MLPGGVVGSNQALPGWTYHGNVDGACRLSWLVCAGGVSVGSVATWVVPHGFYSWRCIRCYENMFGCVNGVVVCSVGCG